MNYKDYYKIMGVGKNATDKEIKTAYRRLARKYHPDISKEKDAEERFKEIGEAYEVLKDSKKRKVYDQYGSDRQEQAQQKNAQSEQAWDWSKTSDNYHFDPDFFESLFGQRSRRAQSYSGPDYQASLNITLEDAYKGGVKEIQLPLNNKVETLKVKIPAGIRAGQQIRLAGKGGEGFGGGKKGDLYITIHYEKHKLFDVKGEDIYLTLPVTPWEVALGANIKVPTLGGVVDLKIPAASQGGQILRLKNRGLPGKHDGSQFIILKVMVPAANSEKAKKIYKEMQEELAFNPRENMRI